MALSNRAVSGPIVSVGTSRLVSVGSQQSMALLFVEALYLKYSLFYVYEGAPWTPLMDTHPTLLSLINTPPTHEAKRK